MVAQQTPKLVAALLRLRHKSSKRLSGVFAAINIVANADDLGVGVFRINQLQKRRQLGITSMDVTDCNKRFIWLQRGRKCRDFALPSCAKKSL